MLLVEERERAKLAQKKARAKELKKRRNGSDQDALAVMAGNAAKAGDQFKGVVVNTDGARDKKESGAASAPRATHCRGISLRVCPTSAVPPRSGRIHSPPH